MMKLRVVSLLKKMGMGFELRMSRRGVKVMQRQCRSTISLIFEDKAIQSIDDAAVGERKEKHEREREKV